MTTTVRDYSGRSLSPSDVVYVRSYDENGFPMASTVRITKLVSSTEFEGEELSNRMLRNGTREYPLGRKLFSSEYSYLLRSYQESIRIPYTKDTSRRDVTGKQLNPGDLVISVSSGYFNPMILLGSGHDRNGVQLWYGEPLDQNKVRKGLSTRNIAELLVLPFPEEMKGLPFQWLFEVMGTEGLPVSSPFESTPDLWG